MARHDDLTADFVRDSLAYDSETGTFTWLSDLKTGRGRVFISAGSVAGSLTNMGYIQIGLLGKRYMAHRLAWLVMTGVWPDGDIDHIDGNPANNQWANLRDVGHMVNLENQRHAQRGSRSGILGATYQPARNKWQARICIQKKQYHLGHFDSAELAHAAYLQAKRQHHAGCTI